MVSWSGAVVLQVCRVFCVAASGNLSQGCTPISPLVRRKGSPTACIVVLTRITRDDVSYTVISTAISTALCLYLSARRYPDQAQAHKTQVHGCPHYGHHRQADTKRTVHDAHTSSMAGRRAGGGKAWFSSYHSPLDRLCVALKPDVAKGLVDIGWGGRPQVLSHWARGAPQPTAGEQKVDLQPALGGAGPRAH